MTIKDGEVRIVMRLDGNTITFFAEDYMSPGPKMVVPDCLRQACPGEAWRLFTDGHKVIASERIGYDY